MDADGYMAWCDEMGVMHAHCTHNCEHPQPFAAETCEVQT